MNKVFPQGDINGNAAAGTKVLPGEAACIAPCCSRRGACLSAFVLLLLAAVAALIALIIILGSPPRTPGAQACVTLTNRTGFLCHDRRSCISASGVCDGIRTCPHGEDEEEALCRKPFLMPFLGQMHGNPEFGNCPGGLDSPLPYSPHEPHLNLRQMWPDVDFLLPHLPSIGDVPQSLPSFLVAHCGNPAFWIYSDQKCDGTNNCGDCSDELSPVTACPPCGPGWWRCPSTVFEYCDCIPRSLCRDHVQHCSDWSDEYSCPGP